MGPTKTPSLDQFTIDLTLRARQGQDRSRCWAATPKSARSSTSSPAAARTTRSSPARRASARRPSSKASPCGSPPATCRRRCKNVALRTLDLGLLQAGAGVKGEFENRLKSVIEEVKASPQPIILFIDEAHTMIGAGGQAGQGDAANLLKPALARGELRTIAATTWAEYKKYFEKDAALARRFQVVKVEEPDEAGGRRNDARPGRDAGEAPQGPHPRRGRRRRRAAVAPLHLRPAAARQVGQPARHGLRPRGDRPRGHAAGRRGLPPPHRAARRGDRHPRAREPRPAPTIDERLDELDRGEGRGRGGAGRAGSALEGRERHWSARFATIRGNWRRRTRARQARRDARARPARRPASRRSGSPPPRPAARQQPRRSETQPPPPAPLTRRRTRNACAAS